VISPETALELTSIHRSRRQRERGNAPAGPAGRLHGGRKDRDRRKVINAATRSAAHFVFVLGFVPARKSGRLTIIVIIDTPKRVGRAPAVRSAAPVFKRDCGSGVAATSASPPDVDPARPVIMTRRGSVADAPVSVKTSGLVDLPVVAVREVGGMPDLRGLSAREATRLLARLGMSTRITGDGVVVDQNPSPGSQFEDGSTCRLVLERVAPIGPNDDSQP
jgi:hypothetical protein